MIHPVPGMAFVVEETVDVIGQASKLKEMGFTQSEAHEQRSGVTGVVFAINDSPRKCMKCGECEMQTLGIKVGDRVVYSKFVAEQVHIAAEDGKPVERLKSVPLDAILAVLK